MTAPNQCQFWNHNEAIRRNYFLCSIHYAMYETGTIDRCPECMKYKEIRYEVCGKCHPSAASASTSSRANIPSRDDRKFPTDSDADEFFVYVLTLDGGEYYVGQTREIHERLHEHRNDMSQSTKGRNPKLAWFTTVPTRKDAADLEQKLQQLNTNASSRRQITRMVVQFKRLVDEIH